MCVSDSSFISLSFLYITRKHQRLNTHRYAHPIEFVFGNLAGVILGPAITNCHPMTTAFWICLALFTTGGSHSGYKFLGAKSHDHHHQYFDCNFGVGGVWDSVFSTDYESWKRAREKRRLMKQKKKKAA